MKSNKQLFTFFEQECKKQGFEVCDHKGHKAVKCETITDAKKVMMKIGLDLILEKIQNQYFVSVR